jgi:hypothetical protein
MSSEMTVQTRRETNMAKTEMPHLGHDKHLCYLNNLGFQISNPEEYKDLVRDAKFMCKICGRVAASAKNLCKPEDL